MILSSTIIIKAQDSVLIGKWLAETRGEESREINVIRKENGVLVGYNKILIDEQGKRYENNEKILTGIDFNGQTGKARYSFHYEGDFYEMKCYLRLENKNKLHLKFSYWGYRVHEIWTRLEEEDI